MERTSTISLTRDRWGIGHAEGESALDAFWAQGWVAAADRIWQMEWDRRRALGRWAEVVGRSGLAEDIFFRRLNLAETAQQHWQQLQPETQAMTSAYADGVNAWLSANTHSLPAEFDVHPAPPEPWEPWHSLALYKVRHLFMGSLARKLWRATLLKAAGPDITLAMAPDPLDGSPMVPDPPLVGHDAKKVCDLLAAASEWLDSFSKDQVRLDQVDGSDSAEFGSVDFGSAEFDGASNSWAIHGDHTASGFPLLAGDPHRGIEFPNAYHQFHMRCDSFDAVGLGFPGVPGFAHFGHNQSVAWCITHGMADDTDLFVEAGPLPIIRTETIEVAGVGPHTVECADTERGPVVLGDPATGPSLALAWTGTHGGDTTFDCLWPMLESSSADDFVDAVKPWVIPINNVLTADKAGTISFHMRGRVLNRPEVSRWTPVPGDERFDWDQIPEVDFEDLYAWRNPDRGFLVTANNPQGNGSFISLDFADSSRHDRLVEIITAAVDPSAGKGLDVDDMARWHLDDQSLLAPKLLANVVDTAEPQTEPGRLALDALNNWNHRMSAHSPGAAVYGVMRRHWTLAVGAAVGLDGFGASPFGPNWPNAAASSRLLHDAATRLLATGRWNALPGIVTTGSLARTLGVVLDNAGSELAGRFGDDPTTWDWPTIHETVCPHPLVAALGPDAGLDHLTPPVSPLPGDGETIRAGTVYPANGDRAMLASVARYVFDVGDWDNSGWVVPHGVSAVAGSGHRFDQRQAWLDGELIPMAYTSTAISEVAVTTERIR